MLLLNYDKITVKDRQRKRISPSELNELKESILARGLLQPPVVFELENTYLLIAGERRYRAVGSIQKDKKTFQCDGEEVPVGMIPVLRVNAEGLLSQREAELDENLQRVDLTWQERAEAFAEIHRLRVAENPIQTAADTGREIAAKAGGYAPHTAEVVRASVIISEHLHRPDIANARSAAEAHKLIMKAQEEAALAELARRRVAKMSTPDIQIREGDLFEILPRMEPEQFDLILADPPYGIDASGGGFRARTVHHHNYDDDEESSWEIQKAILVEGFRLTHRRANLFMFTDIKWWDRLQRVSAQTGWTPFRRPLIWGKSDSEGLAPWGSQGPRITTDFIFYATKGQKGLLASPTDYLRVNRVARDERIYAAEKPIELLRQLIECSTLPGDKILDPCCGSGSTLKAAMLTKRIGIGIEKDSNAYRTAMANVFGG